MGEERFSAPKKLTVPISPASAADPVVVRGNVMKISSEPEADAVAHDLPSVRVRRPRLRDQSL